jgi:hypothetical protein
MYRKLIPENYNKKQKLQYGNVRFFLLEIFRMLYISAQILEVRCGCIFVGRFL